MKGIFYSTIAVLFIAPLILMALSDLSTSQTASDSMQTKIAGDKLASFSSSIDNDLPRAVAIMASNALTQAVVYQENTGKPINDSGALLREIISNGTIYGSGSASSFTISSWAYQLQNEGQLYGFQTSVQVTNLSFIELDSYDIGINVQIAVNASYAFQNMRLYRIYNSTIAVPIKGFDDPLYTLQTNGVIKRSILVPSMNISGPSAFDNATSGGFYMPSNSGPGFLDRMEGRLRPSGKYNSTQAGLESVAYLPVLQANGFSIKESQSDIDYMYFDNSTYSGNHVNQSSYSWLVIDAVHGATYNLTLV